MSTRTWRALPCDHKLRSLCARIADHIPGYTLARQGTSLALRSAPWKTVLVGLTRDGKRLVFHGIYPKPKPHPSYWQNGADATITVAATKSPRSIAADITRRLLPKYLDELAVPDGLAFAAAGEDDAALVAVDDRSAAEFGAGAASGVEAVLGLAGDVAASVFGQSQGDVEDQGPFAVFSGGHTVEDLDRIALLDQFRGHDQPAEEVAPARRLMADTNVDNKQRVLSPDHKSVYIVPRYEAENSIHRHLARRRSRQSGLSRRAWS